MTSKLPDPIRKLAHALAELPGIGPRQATRLALHLTTLAPETAAELIKHLEELRDIKICSRCYFLHQESGELCDMCASPTRDHSTIMIVEKETDLISVENTKKFNGQYFILGPVPKIGGLADWQKTRLENLKKFITTSPDGKATEIILGFNPTSGGDTASDLVAKELVQFTKKITRLGRGLPTGGEIEFADDLTLSDALERRK